jgi:predicted RNA binding protein YcfA (HicA-like mRNA interferase family)
MATSLDITAREVLQRIKQLGGTALRQNGSHVRVQCACGTNKTVVPEHGHEDIKRGTLHGIERALAPCFGAGWLR